MNNEKSISPAALLGGLALKFVSMGEVEAMRVAKLHFGLDGVATRCAGEKDDTFRISAPNGRRYILKVTNPADDVSEVDLQLCVLEHLAAAAPDLPIPRVIVNLQGERQCRHRDAAEQNRHVWMMSYLEGQPLSEVDSTPQARREIGKVLARLRLALADFSHPADSRIVAWDVKHLLRLESLLGEISDPDQRRQLEAGLARFARIEGRLATSRAQVLHNDFTKTNILVKPGSRAFVSGVIDFGDAVRTPIAIDVSTALVNQLPRQAGEQDVFADGRDVLRGYLEIADLIGDELSIIPHLVMGRVVARTLLSISLAKLVPENAAYLLRNTEQGWHQLNWFLSHSEAEISDQFLEFVE